MSSVGLRRTHLGVLQEMDVNHSPAFRLRRRPHVTQRYHRGVPPPARLCPLANLSTGCACRGGSEHQGRLMSARGM